MNQISLFTELIYHQQRQELLNEQASFRLVNGAINMNKRGGIARFEILVRLGKFMQSMGLALEQRYGARLKATSYHMQECSQDDCV